MIWSAKNIKNKSVEIARENIKIRSGSVPPCVNVTMSSLVVFLISVIIQAFVLIL